MTILKKIKNISDKIKTTINKTVEELEKEFEVEEKIDNIKDKTTDIIDDVKEKIEDVTETVSDKFETVSETVSEKIENVKEDVVEKIEAKLENKITFDDFSKVELKLGKINKVEEIPKSKKLYKLTVDFNENKPRQIISGIKEYYKADDLIGKKAIFVTNLLPKKIMEYESNGMILGLKTEKSFSIITSDKKRIKIGTKAG